MYVYNSSLISGKSVNSIYCYIVPILCIISIIIIIGIYASSARVSVVGERREFCRRE